jgi:hypothetical protein
MTGENDNKEKRAEKVKQNGHDKRMRRKGYVIILQILTVY